MADDVYVVFRIPDYLNADPYIVAVCVDEQRARDRVREIIETCGDRARWERHPVEDPNALPRS